ncbi:tetratricopeptide repeat-containing sensor histidine kinase [Flavobacterium sp. H122]|uniref:tetratricopeptide repeat-containing sensor histidine kinase n=1 Tax=Flavobacterium sp. H122 TaxID=2529860 RepID=UPI00145B4A93|nr:tetratricopeptide repeat-containing sensor histidine kinase [Flavobacterium sp. H122]
MIQGDSDYEKPLPFNESEQNKLLYTAYAKALKETNDSVKLSCLSKISKESNLFSDHTLFKKANRLAVELAEKSRNSSVLANLYWDLGNFYTSNMPMNDSAFYYYYKAEKIQSETGLHYNSARMLLNMAIIQCNAKDYTGSEINTFKAIAKLKPLHKYQQLFKCYNNLGIIYNEMGDYKKSLEVHFEAEKNLSKINNSDILLASCLNNIGVVLSNQNKYAKAISFFAKGLATDQLLKRDPQVYATLLDNITYCRLKTGNIKSSLPLFKKALGIRQKYHYYSGIVTNKLHMAEYHAICKDTSRSIEEASEANKIAQKIHSNRDILNSLLLLSKIDKRKNNHHAEKYIALNDSFFKQERITRNKFERIRFETDEYIKESQEQKKQKILILVIGIFTTLVGGLLYLVKYQNTKNKTLLLEREQQKSNEEIYALMIEQHNKIDEGKRQERLRISEELHDGVLSSLFGVRMNIGFLNIVDEEKNIQNHNRFQKELKNIEEEIRNLSHKLNNELLSSDIDFINIVHLLLENQSTISGFKYDIKSSPNLFWKLICNNMKINIYRIIQEAIQNINKHAAATQITIQFNLINNYIDLTITDNGKGFNTKYVPRGIGLKNIASRTKLLNGHFNLESEIGKGTKLYIKIPLKINNDAK